MSIAADPILALVSNYEGLTAAQRRAYSETETRTNFIDRLFLGLGWPVYDREHVERETTVAEGKRPDYIFKLHGIPRLFLEAKPLRDDTYNLDYARDAITKAYNRGVPWAGVTNFVNLVIFDAQEELKPGAPPARVLDLTYGDYLRPDAGLQLLTPDALDQRMLDEQAQRTGVRKRAVPIEKRLYESMRQWRELLFNHLRAALEWKTDAQFRTGDEAIQRLIDRLIFLRNCEDRGIGKTELRALLHRIRSRARSVRVTESLLRIFAEATATYDSELFQTDALIDVLLLGLATRTDVDDTLGEIIEGLYSVPRSYAEYDFAQMDADVLGQVYEQYLGYVPQRVRQRAAQEPLPGMPARQIAMEAKQERRKQRGIYYTPKWVVDYIVRQTVGRFVAEHDDDPDAIANLTVLDPACGSGSFLIRAYETLLEHHAQQTGGDVGHLDRKMREWVLRHNIFGVDLDSQAVQIAMLNLLIRMVREEEELPPLRDNIRLGNSLIYGDEKEMRAYFGRRWREKQAFDWQREFPDIMDRGGFDIVIGNPPYVRIQSIPRTEADYYRATYDAAHGAFDLYVLFIQRAIALLKTGGRLGFITSGKFLKSEYGEKLRGLLSNECDVEDIVDLSAHADVFGEPTSYPILLIARKEKSGAPLCYLHVPAGTPVGSSDTVSHLRSEKGYSVGQAALAAGLWPPASPATQPVIAKIAAAGPPLSESCDKIFVGLQTSADRVYILRKISEDANGLVSVVSKATDKQHLLEPGLLKPLLSGEDVKRYAAPTPTRVLLFPYAVEDGRAQLISPEDFAARFPRTWQYLLDNKEMLENREGGKMRHDRWYAYVYPKNLGVQDEPKIAIPRLVKKLQAAYDVEGRFYLDNVDVNGLLRPRDPYYLLALLNSTLLDFCFRQRSAAFRGDFRSANRQFISPLPIKTIRRDNPKEKACYERVVGLARQMLDLHQRLAAKGEIHDNEREQIEREIARTEREIDDLVYDLYGLTAAERELVEREMAR